MNKLKRALHHLFVPHDKNNYRAKLLHLDFLTLYLIVVLLITVVFKQSILNSNILGYATDITVNKLYELTNAKRQAEGLKPLKYDEKLAAAAQKKAQDMFTKNYWAHYSPEGLTPWNFILSSGYQYEYAGENLAKNFLFSQGVVDAWMNSTSHRKNLLRSEYQDVGFAIKNGVLNGEETTLVIQMFGAPIATPLLDQKETSEPKPLSVPIAAYKEQPLPSTLGISFLPIYFNLNLLFFAVLMLALVIDLYVAIKMKYIRINGKNIIHFLFLGFMIIALLIIRKGAII